MDALRAAANCGNDAFFLQTLFDYLVIYFHGTAAISLTSTDSRIARSLSAEWWREKDSFDRSRTIEVKGDLAVKTVGAASTMPVTAQSPSSLLTLTISPLRKSQVDPSDRHFLRELLGVYSDQLDLAVPRYIEYFRTTNGETAKGVSVPQGLLDPVRNQLDALYADLNNSTILRPADPKIPVVPVFAVARHPSAKPREIDGFRKKLDYTPHMLLSNTQLECLAKPNESSLEEVRSVLEEPLRCGMALADSSLLSGTADIVEPSTARKSGHASTESGKLEEILYHKICQGDPYFFVPMHLGHTPWMTFFTVQDETSQSEWLRLYHFYRDVFPHIAGGISSSIHTAFRSALVESARQSKFLPEDKRSRKIREDWNALSRHFPLFKSVTLSEDGRQVSVTPFELEPSWRVRDPKVFAEEVRSELHKESSCTGIELATAIRQENHLHIQHGNRPETIDLAPPARRFDELNNFATYVTARLDSDIFRNKYTRGSKEKRGPGLYTILTEGKQEFEQQVFRRLAFLLIITKVMIEKPNKGQNSILGTALTKFLNLGNKGDQTQFLKVLFGGDDQFQQYYQGIQDCADSGFRKMELINMPYMPFVKGYAEQRIAARDAEDRVPKIHLKET